MQHGPGTENAFGGVAQAYARLGADRRPRRRLPAAPDQRAAELQRLPELPAHHQVGRAGDRGRRDPGRDAARLHAGAERPAAAGPGRDPDGRLDRGGAGAARLRAAARGRASAPDPADVERGRRGCWSRPSARSSTPARASTTPRPGTSCGRSPSCSRRRSRRASRARAPSRRRIRSSLGSGGRSIPKAVRQFLDEADVIFGIGCSFTTTSYGVKMPKGKRIIHATLDPADLSKDMPGDHALVGDARPRPGRAARRGQGPAPRQAARPRPAP